MNKYVLLWSAAVLFSWCSSADGLPPPWELEETKSKADLIAVAETTKIEIVKDLRHFKRKFLGKIIKVLKADPASRERARDDDSRAEVFFFEPEVPKVKGKLQRVQVGGTGRPRPAVGEPALVFLKRLEESEGYGVVCGRFGYIPLKADSKKELAELSQTIERHRQWSEKIKDEGARRAMVSYYREAAAFVAKTQQPK